MFPGDIYLTRNTDEIGNNSPGYWNHAAICCSSSSIVEAQEEPDAVIQVKLYAFKARYPEYKILRCYDSRLSVLAASHAFDFIGVKYCKSSSVFKWILNGFRGENCVSVVRKSYQYAMGMDPRWIIPDDILTNRIFKVIEHYKDYDNWTRPKDWFLGRIR